MQVNMVANVCINTFKTVFAMYEILFFVCIVRE
jgi:hypothetical protein